MTPLFSICHTTARPGEWRKTYDLWMSRANDPEDVEYVLCVDQRWGFAGWDEPCPTPKYRPNRDWWPDERSPARNVVALNRGRKCSVDGWNSAAAQSTGHVLILVSDDIEPPQDWDQALWSRFGLEEGAYRDFAVHVSTGWCDGPQASSIQILSRARYERLG